MMCKEIVEILNANNIYSIDEYRANVYTKKELIYDIHCMNTLMFLMKLFIDDIVVQESCYYMIGQMIYNNPKKQESFMNSNCLDIVIEHMKKYRDDYDIQSNGNYILGSLLSNNKQLSYSNVTVFELVLENMNSHIFRRNEDLQKNGLYAFSNMNNDIILLPKKVTKIVIRNMKRFEFNESIQYYGLNILFNLDININYCKDLVKDTMQRIADNNNIQAIGEELLAKINNKKNKMEMNIPSIMELHRI